MNETQKPNFSLLNQQEIDALVGFLNDNRSTIDSDVMNQDSVDKLIRLITGDSEHIITSFFDPFSAKMEDILSTFLPLRQNTAVPTAVLTQLPKRDLPVLERVFLTRRANMV